MTVVARSSVFVGMRWVMVFTIGVDTGGSQLSRAGGARDVAGWLLTATETLANIVALGLVAPPYSAHTAVIALDGDSRQLPPGVLAKRRRALDYRPPFRQDRPHIAMGVTSDKLVGPACIGLATNA